MIIAHEFVGLSIGCIMVTINSGKFMPMSSRFAVYFAIIAITTVSHAEKGKKIVINSSPSGAQVEVDGSIVCTTPCSLPVDKAYFGAKHTAFSSHISHPLSARLTKEGYVPRAFHLTRGPYTWTSLNGLNRFEYFLIEQDQFDVSLETVAAFVSPHTSTTAVSSSIETDHVALSSEQLITAVDPAVVAVISSGRSGSGFFISSTGLVATNAHVVYGADEVIIRSSSGKEFRSALIYADPDRDLALIKINTVETPFLDVRTSPPSPGAEVFAIGTPGANDVTGTTLLMNSVTRGIVSGLRQFSDETVENVPGRAGSWIQTDATINHGNSGGPLVDRFGKVVGINTLSFSGTGTPGINFALASAELVQMVKAKLGTDLERHEPIRENTDKTTVTGRAKVEISSDPPGAEINIDDVFFGNTPASISIVEGLHTVKISMKGRLPFERKIQTQADATQHISANLEEATPGK